MGRGRRIKCVGGEILSEDKDPRQVSVSHDGRQSDNLTET